MYKNLMVILLLLTSFSCNKDKIDIENGDIKFKIFYEDVPNPVKMGGSYEKKRLSIHIMVEEDETGYEGKYDLKFDTKYDCSLYIEEREENGTSINTYDTTNIGWMIDPVQRGMFGFLCFPKTAGKDTLRFSIRRTDRSFGNPNYVKTFEYPYEAVE